MALATDGTDRNKNSFKTSALASAGVNVKLDFFLQTKQEECDFPTRAYGRTTHFGSSDAFCCVCLEFDFTSL